MRKFKSLTFLCARLIEGRGVVAPAAPLAQLLEVRDGQVIEAEAADQEHGRLNPRGTQP